MCECPCSEYNEWCDDNPCEESRKPKADCPFCGCMPRYDYDTDEGIINFVSCANAFCTIHDVWMTPEAWSKRPAEEKLKDKVTNLKSQVWKLESEIRETEKDKQEYSSFVYWRTQEAIKALQQIQER